MGLKRKRSTPAVSSPATTNSDATSDSPSAISFYYQHSKPTPALYEKPTWSFPTYEDGPASQHLNSRTRKRHRDDRPDEEQVYASTISKLYDAQRHHPDAAPTSSSHSLPPSSAAALPEKPQRSTLHAFWNIHSRPTAQDAMQVDAPQGDGGGPAYMRCEDCDRPLRDDNAMVLDESAFTQETICAMCRRHVCDICAIQANDRMCLACASGR